MRYGNNTLKKKLNGKTPETFLGTTDHLSRRDLKWLGRLIAGTCQPSDVPRYIIEKFSVLGLAKWEFSLDVEACKSAFVTAQINKIKF